MLCCAVLCCVVKYVSIARIYQALLQGRPHRNLLQAAAPEAAPAVPIPSAVAAAANVTVATLVAPNVTVSGLVSTALLDDAAYVSVPQTTDANNINISVTTASGSTLV